MPSHFLVHISRRLLEREEAMQANKRPDMLQLTNICAEQRSAGESEASFAVNDGGASPRANGLSQAAPRWDLLPHL